MSKNFRNLSQCSHNTQALTTKNRSKTSDFLKQCAPAIRMVGLPPATRVVGLLPTICAVRMPGLLVMRMPGLLVMCMPGLLVMQMLRLLVMSIKVE